MGTLSCTAVSSLQVLMGVISTFFSDQTPADVSSSTILQNGETFDFVIAGGGSAGCVLANRLSEVSNWKILLLEAGGEEPFEADIPAFGNNLKLSPLDWQYWTQPSNTSCGGRPCQWPRGKVLGGGSTINDMIYNRGNKYDYDHWAELGNEGWDFVNGVLPYFKKSENNIDPDIARDTKYHSVGGYQSVGRFPYTDENVPNIIQGYEDIGYKQVDFNGPHVLGVMHLQATQYKGERRSTNGAYVKPILKSRPNLKVSTDTRVTKILINETTKSAYGIEYIAEKNRKIKGEIYVSKEVIVSSGPINSPQLLMLSGIGPKETLKTFNITVVEDSKVGENLQDHVGAFGVHYFVGNTTRPNNSDLFMDSISYSKDVRTGPWSGIGSISVVAYTNSRYANKSMDYPDIQFTTIPSFSDDNDKDYCKVDFAIPWCYYNRITLMTAVLRPKCGGYVTINSTDPFTEVLIYPNYFCDEHDLNVLTDGMNAGLKLGESKTFKDNGFKLDKSPPPKCSHLEFATDEYWACAAMENTHSNYHPVGTCKMGPSNDSTAVVDSNLRVYGVKNLRVIDSSIMPDITSGNTNAPTIMIAEKGADLVKASYGIKCHGKDMETVCH